MRTISHEEALETMAMFHNITPGQLEFMLEEFDKGRGSVVINGIIDQKYTLRKLNNEQKQVDGLTVGEFKREIIFSSVKSRAEHKLQEMVENLDNGEILLEKKNDYIKTDKRDIRVLSCNSFNRGYRCSTAYVDEEISIRMLHEIVQPTLIQENGTIEYFK